MNRIIYILKITLAFGLFVMIGCGEEYDTFSEQAIVSGEIDAFLNKVKPESETFEISPNQELEYLSESKQIIQISEGSFSHEIDNVSLGFEQINRVGDLILNGVTTANENDIFFIEDMYTLNAKIGERAVDAINRVSILSPKNDANSERYLYRVNNHHWTNESEEDQDLLNIDEWLTPQEEEAAGYHAKINTNHTYAIAKPLNLGTETKTEVCVNLPSEFDGVNTNVFLQLKYSTNLVALSWNKENMLFCDAMGKKIPVGFDARIIAVSHDINGNVFFGTIDVVIEEDIVYDLVPQTTSEAGLLDSLSSL